MEEPGSTLFNQDKDRPLADLGLRGYYVSRFVGFMVWSKRPIGDLWRFFRLAVKVYRTDIYSAKKFIYLSVNTPLMSKPKY